MRAVVDSDRVVFRLCVSCVTNHLVFINWAGGGGGTPAQ